MSWRTANINKDSGTLNAGQDARKSTTINGTAGKTSAESAKNSLTPHVVAGPEKKDLGGKNTNLR